MEVQLGDVGVGGGVGVSKSPLCGELPSELLVESMGCENQGEDLYEEVDEEEIMVEVVGSDVFVNGVSGRNADLEGSEWENREETGSQNFSEAVDVWTEGDGNKMGEREVVRVLGAEVWNPGIEAMVVSSSAVIESVMEQTEEVMERTPVEISKEKVVKSRVVDKDSANFVTSKLANHPAEAVVEGKVQSREEKVIILSSGNDADLDEVGEDSMTSHEVTNASDGARVAPSELPPNPNAEGLDNVQVGGVDGAVGEIDLVNRNGGGEILATDSPTDEVFKAKAEMASTGSDCGIGAKIVDEKGVFAAETKDSIVKMDAIVSDVQGENQDCLEEFRGIKFGSTRGADDASRASPGSHADGSGIAEVSEAKDVNIEIQADTVENLPNMMPSSSPGDSGFVQVDSGMHVNEPHLSTSMGEVITDPKVSVSQVKALDGDGSSENDEEVDPKISVQSLENPGNAEMPAVNASTGSMPLSARDSGLKVEMADVKVAECHVGPVVNAEVELDIVVGDCETPQSKEQEVAVQISETAKIPVQLTEASNHGVDELAGVSMMPNDVISAPAVSVTNRASILPDITETAELNAYTTNVSLLDGGDIKEAWDFDVAIPIDEVYNSREAEDSLNNANGSYIVEVHTSKTKLMDVEEERESQRNYDGGMVVDSREPESGTEERAAETDKFNLPNEETIKSASLFRMYQPGHLSTPENEGHFAQSDLVWVEVRSHPWWPGQIFNQADASEKAIKYYRKDSYLVAHFGDRTFAWNDASVLKPFMPYFSQIEKQSNSEAFQNAVNCALEEVSRRVELGLACPCIPKDAYIKIGTQFIENAGIREESSRRCGVYHSSRATFFEPDKLVGYVSDLALCASSRADQLDLVIARAQLSAFYRFKGYRSPTEFPSSGELLENNTDTEQVSDEIVASQKYRHPPVEGFHSRKERSLTELMGETEYTPDAEDESVAEDPRILVSLFSGRKRKALDPLVNESDKRVSIHDSKLSTSMNLVPKPFFKIGECIRRAASQLGGSTSLVKGNNDEAVIDGFLKISEHSEKRSVVVSAKYFSVNQMLLQLQLVAKDPKKRYNVQNAFYTFFLGFRSLIALNRQGRKKKDGSTFFGSGEEFEFDDVNDSYWTDRIVQNYSGERLRHDRENWTRNLQQLPFHAERSVKTDHKSHSRKRFLSGSYPTLATESDDNIKRQKRESSPAELILNFAESKCVPSEINLNKMFRRFGPLMESETEVDHESGRAKMIFKRGSDAEVARNSAEKFNIFGSVLVSYQIGYSPLISVKILPVSIPQCQVDENVML